MHVFWIYASQKDSSKFRDTDLLISEWNVWVKINEFQETKVLSRNVNESCHMKTGFMIVIIIMGNLRKKWQKKRDIGPHDFFAYLNMRFTMWPRSLKQMGRWTDRRTLPSALSPCFAKATQSITMWEWSVTLSKRNHTDKLFLFHELKYCTSRNGFLSVAMPLPNSLGRRYYMYYIYDM